MCRVKSSVLSETWGYRRRLGRVLHRKQEYSFYLFLRPRQMPPAPGSSLMTSGQNFNLVVQRVKNLPAVQETWVQALGWEDSLEKGMATHSSILAWRIPWTEE